MLKILFLALLFTLTSYSHAQALIDLNALSAEASSVIAIEEVSKEDLISEKETVDKVEVIRKQRGLFLALLPITFTVRVVAYPDGAVEMFYPWYSAITVDRNEEIRAQLKIAVDTALKSRLVGSVKAEGPSANPQFTQEEARVVEEKIIEVLSSDPKNYSDTQ